MPRSDHLSAKVSWHKARVGFRLVGLTARAMWCCGVAHCGTSPLALEFDRYGRWLGLLRLLSGHRDAVELLLHPMESVRYFEFAAVKSLLPVNLGRCLDVSSPRLFSLVVKRTKDPAILIANPDESDLALTEQLFATAGLRDCLISFSAKDAASLSVTGYRFDTIWSISVLEHVAGANSDLDALQALYGLLAPGGRLIITVPVDRMFRVETSQVPMYPTQPKLDDGSYFFQRFYDNIAIEERLLAALPVRPIAIEWYGERERGWWYRYQSEASRNGVNPHVADVAEMPRHFARFDSWRDMPGMGIVALAWERRG